VLSLGWGWLAGKSGALIIIIIIMIILIITSTSNFVTS